MVGLLRPAWWVAVTEVHGPVDVVAVEPPTYGAWSASDEVDKITGPSQPPIPRTLDGVVSHLKSAVQAFWGRS